MAGSIGTAYFNVAPNMSGVQGKITGGLKGTGAQFAEQFGGEISGRSAFIVGAIAGIASAATSKALNVLTSSIDTAVKRVDTLNAAQKTFQYMGFAAADSSEAVKAVTKSIQGLPTPLDSAIRGMTGLAATYGDVKLGQKMFTALNDAVLGFGGSAAMVDNAVQQVSQLPMDGPLDAQTWNSLRNSGITPVLVAMGKDMGKSVSQLKEDFGNGTLKVQDFVNELIKLDTQGGGGLVSLQKIALNSTSGISTGFANMQTAVARGMANIIQAVGQKNISQAIAQIGAGFEKVLNVVAKSIPVAIGYIKQMVDFVVKYKDIFTPLAVGAAAAAAAMVALAIASKVAAAIQAVNKAIVAGQIAMATYTALTGSGTSAMVAFNAVTGLNPLGIIIISLTAAAAALTYFFTKTETGKKIFSAFLGFMGTVWTGIKTGAQTVGNFFAGVWQNILVAVNAVKDAFNTAYGAVSNFVSAGINVMSNAISAVINWFIAWRAWFINIGIVIGTILLPKMIQLGIEALKSAASWVAGMAQAGAATATTAAQSVVNFVKMSVAASVNAVKSAAAWTLAAGQTALAWLKTVPGMIASFVQASAASVVNAVKSAAAWVLAAGQTAAAWAISFAAYLLGVATAAAQTLLAGARMAAGWLLALGPIGLIIAAVAGAVALIIANWDSVKGFVVGVWQGIQNAVAAVINWVKGNWPLLLAIITGPIGLAVLYVTRNFDTIRTAVANTIGAVTGFFGSLPSRILGAIGNLGGILYNAGRDMINGLLNGAGSLLSKIGSFFLDKLPGWIQGPFKKALGIHSPSKVFAGFGANISQGLANGVAANASAVSSAVTDLAGTAMSSFGANGLTADIAASATPASASPYSATGGGSSVTNQDVRIDRVILGDASAVKQWWEELNQDTMKSGIGITPAQGATS